MSATDDLLTQHRPTPTGSTSGDLPMPPAPQVAVVACMDARLDPQGLLGLREGDAHVIRNAGGVVTEDAIRSLAISQRLLGTREIVLIHHTDCGMLTFTDDDFKAQVEADTGCGHRGRRSPSATPTRTSASRSPGIQASPFVPYKDQVRGFVYSVTDGTLTEVS